MSKIKKIYTAIILFVMAIGNIAVFAAKPSKTPPLPPSSIGAQNITSNSLTLTWTSSKGATGYKIYMATPNDANYTQIATLSGTSYNVSNLKPATSYWFFVRAYNSYGTSGDSKHINVVTPNVIVNSSKNVIGFATYYYSGDKSSYNSMLNYGNYLNTIITHTYITDGQGNVSGLVPAEQINYANNNSIIPLVMVSNNFSGEVAKQLLESPSNRQNLIGNILNAIKSNGYKGVNIDLEGVYYYDRAYLSTFIKELYDVLKPLGYIITISVPAKTSDSLTNSWNGAYDYAELAKYVDQFVLMTYDEHYPGGTPGAIASIGWVQKVIEYTISVVPKDKVILGLAAYGYDWSSNGTKAYSINGIYNLAANNGATILWDDASKSPYFNYKDASGLTHSVWFENEVSISYKLDLVNSYNLSGIAIWRLGLENAAYWDTIKTKLNK
ncbi:putative sporulation-specific glycosylase YdhD [Caloramator mitchellensis]|uniref:Putative sporulation-specific glycosylase YdhD n=1 Tax=Caloramator mitchellensis TaxID=908809 RepID=A0A0R3JRW0_CALMK|nr:glycosyl hydrolase family 18 protein [Caloramator mitchellensis]KRQ86201.1 putative sporulation-specific glycosylase YdhD [Caloramator mitchellensis]